MYHQSSRRTGTDRSVSWVWPTNSSTKAVRRSSRCAVRASATAFIAHLEGQHASGDGRTAHLDALGTAVGEEFVGRRQEPDLTQQVGRDAPRRIARHTRGT